MAQRIFLKQNLSQRLKLKIVGKIKMAEFLSLPEPDFESHIKEVEKNPLFEILKREKVIEYRKFPGVVNTPKFLPGEDNLKGGEKFRIDGIFENTEVFELVKKIGRIVGERKFCQIISGEKRAGDLLKGYNFSPLEIKKFEEFIDRFHLEKILNPDSFDFSPSGRNLFLIAAFEWEKDNLVIRPVKEESYLIKGRYKINYQKFEMFIAERKIEKSKIDRILKLFRQIDMINRRSTTIYRILECLKEIQLAFFKSADPVDLFPFSQSELARRLRLHPSTIARAISGKSILTPQGEEKALEFFFSRSWAKNLVRKVILWEKEQIREGRLSFPLSDGEIQRKIYQDFGIYFSRRTVAGYRKMLNIPPFYQRRGL